MKNKPSMGWQGWLGIEPAAAGFGDQLAAIGMHPHIGEKSGLRPHGTLSFGVRLFSKQVQ